jgi:putative ABC transport system substrate-binding protein
MNNRRKLIVALGAGALTAPLGSYAQPATKVRRVGFLSARSRPVSFDADEYGGFPRGMRELGYVEGKNLTIEWRFAENRRDRTAELAAELVQLKVDVIVGAGNTAISAAQKATAAIPIVMVNAGDPMGSGFIKSLANPGGNITGLSDIKYELLPKQLQMLHSMVPKLTRVAVLFDPANPYTYTVSLATVQATAQKLGLKILPVRAGTAAENEQAFSAMAKDRSGGVIILRDAIIVQQTRQIAELAAKHRLPSISGISDYAKVGGLLSYGTNTTDQFRRAATYVDKILKGIKPADLPVEQPMTFELFINGKAAKALGLKIPADLLIMANKVIE